MVTAAQLSGAKGARESVAQTAGTPARRQAALAASSEKSRPDRTVTLRRARPASAETGRLRSRRRGQCPALPIRAARARRSADDRAARSGDTTAPAGRPRWFRQRTSSPADSSRAVRAARAADAGGSGGSCGTRRSGRLCRWCGTGGRWRKTEARIRMLPQAGQASAAGGAARAGG